MRTIRIRIQIKFDSDYWIKELKEQHHPVFYGDSRTCIHTYLQEMKRVQHGLLNSLRSVFKPLFFALCSTHAQSGQS